VRINKVLWLFISMLLCSVAYADNIRIDSAEIKWHKYYDNIFIETSDYVIPKVTQTDEQIILEFKNAEAGNFRATLKKSPRVVAVYPKVGDNGSIQIVIDLKKPVKYEIASMYGRGQIVVEISEITMGKLAYKETEKETPPEEIKAEVLHPIKSNKPNVLKGKLIVVDPGHGGDDPGAFAFNGVEEKRLNLKTALYLADDLRKNGASVLMTRKSDVKHDLQSIVEFVKNTKADMYIGVHYNSIIGMSVSGTETYYYTEQSKKLAECVHKEMLNKLQRRDRGLKQAKFYTIHHAEVPAILVEPVYITDLQEGILAESQTFQKQVAASILLGIKDYYTK